MKLLKQKVSKQKLIWVDKILYRENEVRVAKVNTECFFLVWFSPCKLFMSKIWVPKFKRIVSFPRKLLIDHSMGQSSLQPDRVKRLYTQQYAISRTFINWHRAKFIQPYPVKGLSRLLCMSSRLTMREESKITYKKIRLKMSWEVFYIMIHQDKGIHVLVKTSKQLYHCFLFL